MSIVTRRQLLQSGLAVSATTLLPSSSAMAASAVTPATHTVAGMAAQSTGPRERLLMDAGWRFSLGNADDPDKDFEFGKLERERTFAKAGAIRQATAKLDDSKWQTVDLPHDWALELPFISKKPAPEQGARPLGREFPETSIGWYRKTFNLTAADSAKRIQLQFDGVYRDAAIFLNGHYIATNFSGYAPFTLDITDWLHTDKPNVLAVRVDATLGDGWFYEGAGIYRHVWLIKSAPVHLVEWGTAIRSTVTGGSATLKLSSEVRNDSDAPASTHMVWTILDATGKQVATAQSAMLTIAPWKTGVLTGEAAIASPGLWSVETPVLYQAISAVHAGTQEVDRDTTTFGIRTIRFDVDKGFFLNGSPVKIKGTCCHQDHAGVGVALPDRIQYYRVERLKSMGSNALRTSHNPPTPELMDATDSLGMMVMCETRMMDSSPEGLSQLERMIRRFRNHPSIIIWSLGNEETEQGTVTGQRVVTTMRRMAHELDPTRLCTVGMNHAQGTGVSLAIDVQGFNYYEVNIPGFRERFPRQPIIGTETASTVSTRGIYTNDPEAGYVSAYDVNTPAWASTAQKWWTYYDERAFLAGGFAWTGFDYRGEPTPYSWPCVSSHFGIMDTCGFPKDNYFYYKAWWGSEPVLHLFPHWNWPEDMHGKEVSVWCHSNLDSVELFVNNVSVGSRKVERNGHVEWKVPYQPGIIEARGSKGAKVALTDKRETVGAPAKIVLRADRTTIDANGEDVSMVTVEVQDSAGRLMPIAMNEIAFKVSGAGKLIGLGNGDPSSHEPDKASQRKVFNGWAQAIVQALHQPGTITLEASAEGLQSSTITVTGRPVNARPAL